MSDRTSHILDVLDHALVAAPDVARQNAGAFHRYIHARLSEAGFFVESEYQVASVRKGTRHGYIDLVVTHPTFTAIELDKGSPRQKSLAKLRVIDTPGWRVAITRRPPRRVETWWVE